MKEEYKATWFKCETIPTSPFAIITAHNPRGVPLNNPQENEARNRRLTQRLDDQDTSYFPLLAGSKDFSHSESSFGIFLTLEAAVSLALDFDQDAIFWIENGLIHLVDCQSEASETIASWAERQGSE